MKHLAWLLLFLATPAFSQSILERYGYSHAQFEAAEEGVDDDSSHSDQLIMSIDGTPHSQKTKWDMVLDMMQQQERKLDQLTDWAWSVDGRVKQLESRPARVIERQTVTQPASQPYRPSHIPGRSYHTDGRQFTEEEQRRADERKGSHD